MLFNRITWAGIVSVEEANRLGHSSIIKFKRMLLPYCNYRYTNMAQLVEYYYLIKLIG